MGTKKTKMVDLPDGAKYGGEFVNGRPHGQGVKTWPSGLGYEGEFRDGKANGRGVETRADGTRIEGQWCDDDGPSAFGGFSS